METAEEKKLRRRWDKLIAINGISLRRVKKTYILRVGKKITGGKVVATSSTRLETLVCQAEELLDLRDKVIDKKKALTSLQAYDASKAFALLDAKSQAIKESYPPTIIKILDLHAKGITLESLDLEAKEALEVEEALSTLHLTSKVTLESLAEKYIASLPSSQRISIKKLTELFVGDRKSSGMSDRYLYALKSSFRPLLKWMGKKHAHTVSKKDVEDYLSVNYGTKAPKTFNNILITLKALWAFALAEGYVKKHVALDIGKRKVVSKEVGVFTPLAVQRLLESARAVAPDILIPLAIQAFSGLRRAEMGALRWEDIGDDYVVVKALVSKTSTRRTVPIMPPLRALLDEVGKGCADSLVYPKTDNAYRKRKDKVVKASGIEWVNNGLRHSFVTYRLIDTGDVNRTSLEAGHTAEMLHAHYRSLVADEKRKADAYWSMFTQNVKALPKKTG